MFHQVSMTNLTSMAKLDTIYGIFFFLLKDILWYYNNNNYIYLVFEIRSG